MTNSLGVADLGCLGRGGFVKVLCLGAVLSGLVYTCSKWFVLGNVRNSRIPFEKQKYDTPNTPNPLVALWPDEFCTYKRASRALLDKLELENKTSVVQKAKLSLTSSSECSIDSSTVLMNCKGSDAASNDQQRGDEDPPVLKKRRRVLFITPYHYHITMMDRWYFEMYGSSKSIEHWDTYMWGPGYLYFDEFCSCQSKGESTNHNANQNSAESKAEDSLSYDGIVIDAEVSTNFDLRNWNKFVAGNDIVKCDAPGKKLLPLVEDASGRTTIGNGLQDRSLRCSSVRPLTFGEKLQLLFNGRDAPFDMILFSWVFGPKKREHLFEGMPKTTVIALYQHEWHTKNLFQVEELKPNVIFYSYVDQFEENFGLRNYVKQLGRDDWRRSLWFPKKGQTSTSNIPPYKYVGPDTLAAFAPLGVMPTCFSCQPKCIGGEPLANCLTDKVNRPLTFIMIGAADTDVYPTRGVIDTLLDEKITPIHKQFVRIKHPGYTEIDDSTHCSVDTLNQRLEAYSTYLTSMERSKICIVGQGATFTLRKYKEAMAAGCLVVGDIPADHNLSQFVVNWNLTVPNNINVDEVKDRKAVAEATGETLKDESIRKDSLPLNNLSYVPLMPNPYDDGLSVTKRRKVAKEVADRLEAILADYESGKYDDMIAKARRVVLIENSWQAILTDWMEPAIEAFQRGERGVLRMPRYFAKHGRKYETRHRYLLTEWIIARREEKCRLTLTDDEQVAERERLKQMTFDDLLAEATTRLGNDIPEDCGAANSRQDGAPQKVISERMEQDSGLDRSRNTGVNYFEGMSDFDVKFLIHRDLYSQRYALDDFSHRDSEHILPLYRH